MAEISFDNSYARLPEAFYARVQPAPVPEPELIAVNAALAGEMGIEVAWLRSDDGVAMLSGNALPEAADPLAMIYAGHQFGGFSPQLGDGRAVLLGEVIGRDGVRRDLQLKGSGQTPFSRQGDGKSPLGPVIREYVMCEAMAALGIPTTRALAAVATGESVYRETALPGGVFARVASSHVRVGTFQYFASRGDADSLRRLADYVIERHGLSSAGEEVGGEVVDDPAIQRYASFLESVVRRQAALIARWMQVGFIHGVMNTDNMQIVGETIDYGPCAFMEAFDPATVFSSIDRQGRYAWGNQPGIGQWNLARLAETLIPLLGADEDTGLKRAEAAIESFAPAFNEALLTGFERKLGLVPGAAARPGPKEEGSFLDATFVTMKEQAVDFTLFFRRLTQVAQGGAPDSLIALFADAAAGEAWLARWHAEAGARPGEALDPSVSEGMARVNPIFIPRNHRVEEAIQAAMAGDMGLFEKLNRVLARPFDEQPEHAEYEHPARPEEVVEATFCGT